MIEDDEPPPTLAYATQPRFGNLIITPTAGGVSITILPDRKEVRAALVRFVLVLSLTASLLWAAWYVRADLYGVLFGTGVGVLVTLTMVAKLISSLETTSLTADPGKLAVMNKAGPQFYPRAMMIDLVATRYADTKGFWLQLRLKDGQNVNLGRGSETEVRELETTLRNALKLSESDRVQ